MISRRAAALRVRSASSGASRPARCRRQARARTPREAPLASRDRLPASPPSRRRWARAPSSGAMVARTGAMHAREAASSRRRCASAGAAPLQRSSFSRALRGASPSGSQSPRARSGAASSHLLVARRDVDRERAAARVEPIVGGDHGAAARPPRRARAPARPRARAGSRGAWPRRRASRPGASNSLYAMSSATPTSGCARPRE